MPPSLMTGCKTLSRVAILLLGTILLVSAAMAAATPIPVTLSSATSQTVGGPFTVCARFGDVVDGLTTSSIQVTNGTAANLRKAPNHAIACGYVYSAALRGDGTLTGWGRNYFNLCNVPSGGGFSSIFTNNGTFGFALRLDGSLVPWGTNTNGVFTLPATQDFLELGLGDHHVIGLRADGSLDAWGDNWYLPSGNNFKAVAAGYNTSFALRTDGSLVAWGDNSLGLLNVPSGNDFVAVTASMSGHFAVALRANGSLVFWGEGDSIHSVPAGNDFVAISAGCYHCLALRANGSLAAWGDITSGQCDLTSPDLAGKQFVAIAAGGCHNLALRTDGVLVAWGDSTPGGDPCAVPNGLSVRSPGYGNYCFFDVIPAGLGEVSVFIPEGSSHDLASKPTAASNLLTRTNVGQGTLRVTIDPPAAVAAGAQWRLVGTTTWLSSGTSEITLISGDYPVAVEFKSLAGRATPEPVTVTIRNQHTTDLHVFQNGLPVIASLAISPAAPTRLDTIKASCSAIDPEGGTITDQEYQWLRGNVLMATGPTLPTGITAKGQVWTLHARACDELGDWCNWAPFSFTIANTPPTQPIVKILPATPTPADDLIVDVQEYSVDPDGDAVGYDFVWYVSRDGGTSWIHKAELDGSSQVSHLYIHDGDLWRVDYTPYEKAASKPNAKPATGPLAATKVIGKPGQDQVYVGVNHPPALSFKTVTGAKWPNGRTTFSASWNWSDTDGDACTVQLYWTDRGAWGLHTLAGPVAAKADGASGAVTLPGAFPVYLFAVITDAKGAATQVTSSAVTITKGNAADPAWLGRVR